MFRIVLIALFMGCASLAGAQQTLTVMAKSGMYLRTKADVKSPSVKKIPYGDTVVLLPDTTPAAEMRIEEIKDFFISGRMIKVNYKGSAGYVFSGFLTGFPMPQPESEERAQTIEYNYLKNTFASVEKYKIINEEGCEGEGYNCVCSFTEKFGHDITYYFNQCGEGGITVKIKIPGMTITEAYFMAKQLYIYDEIYFYSPQKNEFTIKPKDGGAGCYYTVLEKIGIVTISYECGC